MNSVLLEHFNGVSQIRIRVGDCVRVRRYLKPPSGSIHLVHGSKKSGRSDEGKLVDFVRLKKERVRCSAREKHELSGRDTKDLRVHVDAQLTVQNVEHLMF